MPPPKRNKLTSSRAEPALPNATMPAAKRSQLQERSTDELNIDATQQHTERAGRAQIAQDTEATTSRANPKDPSKPSKSRANTQRITRAPSTSSSDDFIHHEDPNEPSPRLPPNPRPDKSEAPNHSPTVYGAHCSTRKREGRITGRVHASAVPAATKMGGFEEFLASSSPRVDRASLGGRESGNAFGSASIGADVAEGLDAAGTISRPPSAHAPRAGQATPSFLQMSAFKRRPRQPSLLHMVQQQQRGQQELNAAESATGDTGLDDSVLRDLEGSSPQGGLRVEALSLSGATKRKARAMEAAEDDEVNVPSSPPALRASASSADVGSELEADERAEVQVPATQDEDIQIFEDDDADPRPMAGQRNSQGHTIYSRSQPARLTQEPSRDRVISSQPPQSSAAARPDIPSRTEALPRDEPHQRHSVGRTPLRRRTGRMIRPKHAPPTQRSSSPPLSATSPISSPPSSAAAAQQPQEVLPPATAASTTHPNSKKVVKITRHRSDGRPITNVNANANASGTATSASSRHTARTAQKTAHPPVVKTADLRALLPKRRRVIQPHHQHDTFDLPSSSPSSSEAEDNSELPPQQPKSKGISGPKPRATTATATVAMKRQPLKAKSVNAKVVPRAAIAIGNKDKTRRVKTAPEEAGRTYARPTRREPTIDVDVGVDVDLDEEVDPDADAGVHTSHRRPPARASKTRELASAARHFIEVDEWELSFESAGDVNGGSSSPWR